jgi:chemotaxis protein MotB
MRRARARRRPREEEHVNHEAWAIPYADLLTLLLAFFVVMYAISSLNTGKYRVLADALSVAFKGGTVAEDIGPMRPSGVSGLTVLDAVHGRDYGAPAARNDQGAPAARNATGIARTARPLPLLQADAVAMRVARATVPQVMRDQITVRRHSFWVEVEIRNDVLFPSGSAQLNPEAEKVMAQLALTLRGFGNPIRVEGHTDDVPIEGGMYRDNWDLSAARAAAVVRVLVVNGVDPGRLAVLGFGEHRPARANDSPEGRSANRRVLLAILGSGDAPEGDYGRERGSSPSKPVP